MLAGVMAVNFAEGAASRHGCLMSSVDHALDLFSRQFNCAQAIIGAYGPAEGLDEKLCMRIAAAFGGGIARLGETCGVVSGALMVLGLRHWGDAAANPQAKAALYERARDFIARFKARNGSAACRDLLGFDISTPEGWAQMQQHKTHVTVCPKFVRDAAEILDEMHRLPARTAG
jgi:C_GCAxxG_C_C family probable redox protein